MKIIPISPIIFTGQIWAWSLSETKANTPIYIHIHKFLSTELIYYVFTSGSPYNSMWS